jgi:hypothetical protein
MTNIYGTEEEKRLALQRYMLMKKKVPAQAVRNIPNQNVVQAVRNALSKKKRLPMMVQAPIGWSVPHDELMGVPDVEVPDDDFFDYAEYTQFGQDEYSDQTEYYPGVQEDPQTVIDMDNQAYQQYEQDVAYTEASADSGEQAANAEADYYAAQYVQEQAQEYQEYQQQEQQMDYSQPPYESTPNYPGQAVPAEMPAYYPPEYTPEYPAAVQVPSPAPIYTPTPITQTPVSDYAPVTFPTTAPAIFLTTTTPAVVQIAPSQEAAAQAAQAARVQKAMDDLKAKQAAATATAAQKAEAARIKAAVDAQKRAADLQIKTQAAQQAAQQAATKAQADAQKKTADAARIANLKNQQAVLKAQLQQVTAKNTNDAQALKNQIAVVKRQLDENGPERKAYWAGKAKLENSGKDGSPERNAYWNGKKILENQTSEQGAERKAYWKTKPSYEKDKSSAGKQRLEQFMQAERDRIAQSKANLETWMANERIRLANLKNQIEQYMAAERDRQAAVKAQLAQIEMADKQRAAAFTQQKTTLEAQIKSIVIKGMILMGRMRGASTYPFNDQRGASTYPFNEQRGFTGQVVNGVLKIPGGFWTPKKKSIRSNVPVTNANDIPNYELEDRRGLNVGRRHGGRRRGGGGYGPYYYPYPDYWMYEQPDVVYVEQPDDVLKQQGDIGKHHGGGRRMSRLDPYYYPQDVIYVEEPEGTTQQGYTEGFEEIDTTNLLNEVEEERQLLQATGLRWHEEFGMHGNELSSEDYTDFRPTDPLSNEPAHLMDPMQDNQWYKIDREADWVETENGRRAAYDQWIKNELKKRGMTVDDLYLPPEELVAKQAEDEQWWRPIGP